ncbi:MAG: hypothetical protein PHR81_12000 [Bacteroidales bacterium]|jgi:4-amino-4-deoxy-L-arabinose transferase-like glycosyltransferase|nr:hypothetical protein [Bacteroidales bacterium]
MVFFKKFGHLFVLIIFFLLHFPFLKCDPDTFVDPTIYMRDAWTDEGLYSSQIRNYVDYGTFSMTENSTFVRGPLFNIIQYPFFKIFGTKLIVGRLVVLLFTCLVLFLFLSHPKLRTFGLFMVVFSLLEFHVFQFTHYSMAEMMCTTFILLGLYFLFLSRVTNSPKKEKFLLFFSVLSIFCCYSTKIQFLYAGAIVPASLFCISVKTSFSRKKILMKDYNAFFWAIAFSAFFALLYFLAWFLPNKEFYLYVMSSETSGRFPSGFIDFWNVAKFNYKHIIWLEPFKVIVVNFYVMLVAALVFFIFKKRKARHPEISIFALVWFLVELHKIPMTYLPNQYLTSALFAAGIFIASVYSEMTAYFRKLKIVFIIAAILVGLYNLNKYGGAYNRRSFQLKAINSYLANYDLKGKLALGAWAASSTWECKAYTIPVWDKYFNWKDPINTFKPAIVLTEFDERDADYCYKNQGIDLNKVSDSSRTFGVSYYKVVVYWIKQNQ